MQKGIYKVNPEVKVQILKRIEEEGVSISKAAEEHYLSTQTIYGWIAKGIISPSAMIEFSRLKLEVETLYEIISKLTFKLSLPKKETWLKDHLLLCASKIQSIPSWLEAWESLVLACATNQP